MGAWPSPLALPESAVNISVYSPNSLGHTLTGFSNEASRAWGAVNEALFIPFRISVPIIATKLWVINGTIANGNIDMGIYSWDGTRLVSIGTTVQTGTSVRQVFNIADTLIGPGLFYLGLALSSASGTVLTRTYNDQLGKAMGCAMQASAFALPATATFDTWVPSLNGRVPICGLTTGNVL